MTTAKVRKNRTVSVIWTLPLIALGISAWLLYSSLRDAGIDITILFHDASGIVPGKTQVMARGIPVGLVTKMHPDLKNKQIAATVKMDKDVAEQLVDDTLFWVVRPELSASSIHGLDTILSGSYIGIQVGSSPNPRRIFAGLGSAPPISPDTPGLHLKLRAETLGSIQVGTGIYYRNIQIGEVQKFQLEGDKNVTIELFVKPEFARLVREGSRFCNASGIHISGKLPALKIEVESLASLLRGGILLHTPEQLASTPAAQSGQIFSLYPNFAAAEYGIPMTLTLASSEDISEGATKVVYRGAEIGFVKEITFSDDRQPLVTAHILLDPRAEQILRSGTRFWLVKPEISPAGITNLPLLLSGTQITFQPGEGDFQDHFAIQSQAPPQVPLRPGQLLSLQSDRPVDLTVNSPVYFKNLQAGEIVDVRLEGKNAEVRIDLFIYREFLDYLSPKSRFWEQSAVQVRGSLAEGLTLSAGPLARMLRGGISFVTPDLGKKGRHSSPATDTVFTLHRSYDEAVRGVAELQRAGTRVTLRATEAESLSIGAPLLYKKIKIGEVENFRLAPDQQAVLVDLLIEDNYKHLVTPRTRFFNSGGVQLSGGLDGIKLQSGSLQSILTGGISCINPEQENWAPVTQPYPLYPDLDSALHADHREFTVLLGELKGLKVGAPLRYQGIELAKIVSLQLANGAGLIATLRIPPDHRHLLRRQSKIWVEEAEVTLSGVKNAETLLFGSYLNLLPGDGDEVASLKALDQPPRPQLAAGKGLPLILLANHLGSLDLGSPVYYRQVPIGEVVAYDLAPSLQMVRIHVRIDHRYRAAIHENTKFWQVSGTRIEGGIFSGITIAAESLTAIIRGGIALATPEGEAAGAPVTTETSFVLHDQAEDEWLQWRPDLRPKEPQ